MSVNTDTPLTAVSQTFVQLYGRSPTIFVRAPGRVNLLGAHVDYNEGWVLPTAVDRHIWLAAAPSYTHQVSIYSANFGQQAAFLLPYLELQSLISTLDWINYPIGVAWALQETGHELVGMDVVFGGDIPMAAGLSSSAAVEMAFVLAWETLSGFQLNNLTRAKIGQRTENEYLGVGSGIMDQFACLHGKANHAILLDCRTLSQEMIPLPSETAVLIADSGIRRQLTRVNYNHRPAECHEAFAILRQQLPDIQTLRDISPATFEIHAHRLPERLRRRAQHVVEECQRVLDGAEALKQGDVPAFGRFMRQSHISSRDNYEVSIPELDVLAAAAWAVPGCYGARFGGGGFGGCMQVLAAETAVPAIQQAMQEAFQKEFGQTPPVFVCKTTDGASLRELHRP